MFTDPAFFSSGDYSDYSIITGGDSNELLRLWRYWLQRYSSKLEFVTLTSAYGHVQLRFWLGKPASIRFDHVDSCGSNLIVHVDGPSSEESLRRLLRDNMVMNGGFIFHKYLVDGVEVWQRI